MNRARNLSLVILFTACASGAASAVASAQMPPSIKGPIDAAKRAATKTSNQINNEQKVGNAPTDSKAGAMPPATQSAQKTAPVSGKAAAKPAKVSADSSPKRGSVTQNGSKGSVTFYREVFNYNAQGRRDPFLSLMATGELRPMITDLTLIGIIYDETGRNSVAIVVDASTGGQTYRKRVGDNIGRIRVTKISEKDITLSVDEFGFTRQETLLIERNPRTGARRP